MKAICFYFMLNNINDKKSLITGNLLLVVLFRVLEVKHHTGISSFFLNRSCDSKISFLYKNNGCLTMFNSIKLLLISYLGWPNDLELFILFVLYYLYFHGIYIFYIAFLIPNKYLSLM